MGAAAIRAAAAIMAAGSLVACSDDSEGPSLAAYEGPSSSTPITPSLKDSTGPKEAEEQPSAESLASNGQPQLAELTIPALGLRNLTVVPYVGKTDDARGTKIQDRGLAASPHGPRGGVGPGGVGNYQITAHRLSSTQAFLTLPKLQAGQRAIVVAGGIRYVYEIRDTRETSFRSPRSLAEQRAAVPGEPGKPATQAFITLSTCSTPEDHAEGNYWSDRFGNPEHRIDKIGVLVRSTKVA